MEVLLALDGDLETELVHTLHGERIAHVARRCVDAAEVHGAAAAGLGDVAIVHSDIVDPTAIDDLRRAGMRVLVVGPGHIPADAQTVIAALLDPAVEARYHQRQRPTDAPATDLSGTPPLVLATSHEGDQDAWGSGEERDEAGRDAHAPAAQSADDATRAGEMPAEGERAARVDVDALADDELAAHLPPDPFLEDTPPAPRVRVYPPRRSRRARQAALAAMDEPPTPAAGNAEAPRRWPDPQEATHPGGGGGGQGAAPAAPWPDTPESGAGTEDGWTSPEAGPGAAPAEGPVPPHPIAGGPALPPDIHAEQTQAAGDQVGGPAHPSGAHPPMPPASSAPANLWGTLGEPPAHPGEQAPAESQVGSHVPARVNTRAPRASYRGRLRHFLRRGGSDRQAHAGVPSVPPLPGPAVPAHPAAPQPEPVPLQSPPTPQGSPHPLAPPLPDPGVHRQVIAVAGPPGAPGRTTLTLALAAETAGRGIRTLVIDADTVAPGIVYLLALPDEAAGIASLAYRAQHGQLDRLILTDLAQHTRWGFDVVSGIGDASRWKEVPEAALAALAEVARDHYDLVLIDTAGPVEGVEQQPTYFGPGRDAARRSAVEVADRILVVGAGDPLGMRRLLTYLRDFADPKATIVVNRLDRIVAGQGAERGARHLLARYAQVERAHVIRRDPDQAALAALTGEPVRGGMIGEDVAALADLLFGPAVPGAAPTRQPRWVARTLARLRPDA